ncbi:MAG: hypothetical protein ACOYN4_00750 [Bacteroidales bacterium]
MTTKKTIDTKKTNKPDGSKPLQPATEPIQDPAPDTQEPAEAAPEGTGHKSKVSDKRLKELSAQYDTRQFYFTSDGTAFTEAQHAYAHAKNLQDNIVVSLNRMEG